ncbi:hypothetical protein FQA39_LY08430 [Lamprigera yunnana]|nr:hypothetical protein FQA39_LY08430 [Lamprigera yunnana]
MDQKKAEVVKKQSDTLMEKKISKTSPCKPNTHLFWNNKFSKNIKATISLKSLCVIYLHNNEITKIENIESAVNLKHLFLQQNKIKKIENLNNLVKLEKLYLGHNEISVLEGLETLTNLKELHLEKQNLNGDSLCFDHRSIFAIANSLKILRISHNNITTITNLAPLKNIETLDASHNMLGDFKEVCDTLRNWYYIYEAKFHNNPIAKDRRYRENIISSSHKLAQYSIINVSATLDDKDINEVTRCFLKRFELEKSSRPNKQIVHIPEWATQYGQPILQKAVYESLLKNTRSCFDTTLHNSAGDIYVPWKAMPKKSNKLGKFTLIRKK